MKIVTEHSLISCAKAAWQSVGKHELHHWRQHHGAAAAVIASGKPLRARQSYTFVFRFVTFWEHGTRKVYLAEVAKAPWHKRMFLYFDHVAGGRTVVTFNRDTWVCDD